MWLDEPPPIPTAPQIPLLRPKPGASVSGRLCGEPLRCFIHFAANRSWPCTGRGCFLCGKKIGRRCYAYYPVCDQKNHLGIIELTSLAENQLITQMEPFSHEPCGVIKVYRPAGKRNQPCVVTWTEPKERKQTASSQLDGQTLKRALFRIWQLPDKNGEEDDTEYFKTLNEVISLKTRNTT